MYEEDEDEEMDMPTPCENCGQIFDLHDGIGSDLWYSGIVICSECAEVETEEIELNDALEDCQNEISDAEFTLKERGEELVELTKKIKYVAEKREALRK